MAGLALALGASGVYAQGQPNANQAEMPATGDANARPAAQGAAAGRPSDTLAEPSETVAGPSAPATGSAQTPGQGASPTPAGPSANEAAAAPPGAAVAQPAEEGAALDSPSAAAAAPNEEDAASYTAAGAAGPFALAAPTQLDRVHKTAAQLKVRAMARVAALEGAALNRQFPLETRVSVFLDVAVPEYLIERATVYLDGRRLGAFTYTRDQALALLREADSMHRIVRANVAPGPHRLSVRFRGRWLGDGDDAPPVVGRFAIDFAKTTSDQLLILPVSPSALAPPAGQQSWQWVEDPEDARLGMVRFLRATDRPFAALLELLEIEGAVAKTQYLPRGYYTLLAHSYVDLGIREQAHRALVRARVRDDDQRDVNEAVLRLAELEYKRDHYVQALALLEGIRTKLTSAAQTVAWRDIGGRVLMAQKRYAEAVGVMDAIELPAAKAPQVEFNLAVALIKSGAAEKGHELLADMGTREERAGEVEWAMRMRANLALGFDYLRKGRGEEAQVALARIPWAGPFTSYALAGLGWSELAPDAGRDADAAPEEGFHFGPFVFGGDGDEPAPRRALVAWNELATRAPLDLAVHEALIAKPYTLEQLGAGEQALAAYRRAIEVIKRDQRRLAEYGQALRADRLDEVVAYGDYSALPQAAWMRELVASHRFAQLQKNYLDLQLLQGALLRLDARGTQGLRTGLAYAAVQQSRAAQRVLADGMRRQRQILDRYLIQARLGIARVYAQSRETPAGAKAEVVTQDDREAE